MCKLPVLVINRRPAGRSAQVAVCHKNGHFRSFGRRFQSAAQVPPGRSACRLKPRVRRASQQTVDDLRPRRIAIRRCPHTLLPAEANGNHAPAELAAGGLIFVKNGRRAAGRPKPRASFGAADDPRAAIERNPGRFFQPKRSSRLLQTFSSSRRSPPPRSAVRSN